MSLDIAHGGVRAGLAAVCVAGLGLVMAAPWASQGGWWAAPFLYAVFDPVCHQIAERSFHLLGEPLAVCHRCTALYLGFALGVVCWPVFPAAAARLLARPRWILAFAAPLAVDALLLANSPASRFGTGLLAAFPVALLALAAVSQLTSATSGRSNQHAAAPGGSS